MCNRDFSCGGCMDVDNQTTKQQTGQNAPLDRDGQLTRGAASDVRQMLKD